MRMMFFLSKCKSTFVVELTWPHAEDMDVGLWRGDDNGEALGQVLQLGQLLKLGRVEVQLLPDVVRQQEGLSDARPRPLGGCCGRSCLAEGDVQDLLASFSV